MKHPLDDSSATTRATRICCNSTIQALRQCMNIFRITSFWWLQFCWLNANFTHLWSINSETFHSCFVEQRLWGSSQNSPASNFIKKGLHLRCFTEKLTKFFVKVFMQSTSNWMLKPILTKCSISIPPENVRKPLVFWRFQGDTEIEHWAKMGYSITFIINSESFLFTGFPILSVFRNVWNIYDEAFS